MKRSVKKLVLNRETVRRLQDTELAHVAGGLALPAPPPVIGVLGPPIPPAVEATSIVVFDIPQ